jgi:hypothetical protein
LGQEKEKCNKIIMNKRQIIASLNNIANELDNTGLYKEANEITDVMVRLSQVTQIQHGVGGGLPYKDRSLMPGGEYTTKLPDSGPIPGRAYNTPSNRGINVRPKYPVKQ